MKLKNLAMMRKVKRLRLKGLSYSNIAKLLNNHKTQVYRWSKYLTD